MPVQSRSKAEELRCLETAPPIEFTYNARDTLPGVVLFNAPPLPRQLSLAGHLSKT